MTQAVDIRGAADELTCEGGAEYREHSLSEVTSMWGSRICLTLEIKCP